MAQARLRNVRRVSATLAWFAAAAALAHLSLDSTRPRSIDLHGFLAAAAVAAVILGAVSWLDRGIWLRAISGLAGALAVLGAVALIFARAAHETGIALIVAGGVIAVLAVTDPGTVDSQPARMDQR